MFLMEYLLHNLVSSEPIFNAPVTVEACEAEYAGRKAPEAADLSNYVFEQTVFPLEGGNLLLRLRKPLVLALKSDSLRFTVTDWGIEMDCPHLWQLPREVARRFLLLLSAAEEDRLTEQEKADWVRISDYVDFQHFCIDRSGPRYMEGTLRSNASVVIVEWHDGNRETLDQGVAQALSEVNPGERFSAFVKLGANDKAVAIERVSLLGSPSEQEDWQSWPRKN